MATITIKDLSDNTELDRKAMQAISGGARLRSSAGAPRAGGIQPSRPQRIVDFRTGVAPARHPDDPSR